jgi:rhomboid protease GluP
MTDDADAIVHHQAELAFLHRLHAATPRVFATPAIVALNALVFLAMLAMGVSVLGGRPDDYLKFGANFGPLTSGGEWWRLVTCTFVHAGILHILFNMWALWDCGRLCERLFGNAWFAAIYLFAGICGSFASMLWRNEAVSLGASGAVFGVFGALLAYTFRERGSIPPSMLNRLRISTSIFVTFSLFYGFANSGIDNAAHLGGLAAGTLMGFIAARPLEAAARARGHARRIALAVLIAAVALPSAARFAPDTSRVYLQAVALQKAIDAFAADERRLSADFEALAKRARDNNLDEKATLRELRDKLLPAWNDAVARLSAVELDAGAPMRGDYDSLMRYAQARRDMTAALADFLEAGTPASRQNFIDKRAATEAALKDYRERQTKK